MMTLRFILSVIFGVIAYALYPEGGFSIPLSQLTLGNIARAIGAVIFGILTITVLFDFKGDNGKRK